MEELTRLIGRFATPTVVGGDEAPLGSTSNRARMLALAEMRWRTNLPGKGGRVAVATNGMLRKTAKSWYGLPVDITVSRSNWHRVMIPGISLPHLGLVNLVARCGLPLDKRLAITWRHELGHLQTLPLPLAHLLLILWPRRGRRKGSRWQRVLVGLVAQQAAWELAAESYVRFHARRSRSQTTGRKSLYAALWSVIGLLGATGTVFLISREKSRDGD
jgi:hypothetical protein